MVKTASTMLPLGTKAPHFSLLNVDGRTLSTKDVAGPQGLLVMFLCNHCPFVKHLRSAIAEFAREYQAKGLGVVAISSNDAVAYTDDSPEKMIAEARVAGYTFPYLHDESQAIAIAYKAACTPDFFLFNRDLALVYRGQFDNSRPTNGRPITGADLRLACDTLLAGKTPLIDQHPSIGCNIKWKPGKEPEYFTGVAAVE